MMRLALCKGPAHLIPVWGINCGVVLMVFLLLSLSLSLSLDLSTLDRSAIDSGRLIDLRLDVAFFLFSFFFFFFFFFFFYDDYLGEYLYESPSFCFRFFWWLLLLLLLLLLLMLLWLRSCWGHQR